MNKDDRTQVQLKWQKGIHHVICATIAFGMGIDKADVRFVVHYTLPNSLEGYYQETGRAGRDGKPSECILFYAYADTRFLRKFIYEGEGTKEQKDCQHNNLNRVVQFCVNKFDCRRTQVLQYFGEKFEKKDCNATCDNCRVSASVRHEDKDMTETAKSIVQLLRECNEDKITMIQLSDIYRGSKVKKVSRTKPSRLDVYADDHARSSIRAGIRLKASVEALRWTEATSNVSSTFWSPRRS